MELDHSFEYQINGYYCGPAATRVALSVRGLTPSQSEVARSLGTTVNGTDSSWNVVRTLNSYLHEDVYNAVLIPGEDMTEAEQLQWAADVRSSLAAGYAVVANVVGDLYDGSRWHSYNGGHYVTIVGVDGDRVLVADVNDGPYWASMRAVGTWVAKRGYATAVKVPAHVAVPETLQPTLFLIDIASPYQDGLDYAAAAASGVQIFNVKTSEGVGYVNPQFVQSVVAARGVGGRISTFHWLDSSGSGRQQAQLAFSVLQSVGTTNVAHIVDCEDDADYATLVEYVNEMQRLLGRPIGLYTGDWWWEARGWNGAVLTPWLHAAPNSGYLDGYPGDSSSQWIAGYGGWPLLEGMQYAVQPIPGVHSSDVSLSRIKRDMWLALSGEVVADATEEDEDMARPVQILVQTTDDDPAGDGVGNSICLLTLREDGQIVKANIGNPSLVGPVGKLLGQAEIVYVSTVSVYPDAGHYLDQLTD